MRRSEDKEVTEASKEGAGTDLTREAMVMAKDTAAATWPSSPRMVRHP